MTPPKMIVCPIDFSPASTAAVSVAADQARHFGASLCLVYVVPFLPRIATTRQLLHEAEYQEELRQEAARRLEAMVADLRASGTTAESELGSGEDAAGEILRIVEHRQADMLVIATRGISGWHPFLHGSVAEKVIRLARCPVLLLPAGASE